MENKKSYFIDDSDFRTLPLVLVDVRAVTYESFRTYVMVLFRYFVLWDPCFGHFNSFGY